MKKYPYRSLIDCLLYCTLTSPFIFVVVSELTKYSSDPGLSMWRGAIHLLKYLRTTSSMGLDFNPCGQSSSNDLKGFRDTGFNGSKDTGRSRCGFLVFFRDCIVGFSSLFFNVQQFYFRVKLSTWMLYFWRRMLFSLGCSPLSLVSLKNLRSIWL